jgi:hypothetical protein
MDPRLKIPALGLLGLGLTGCGASDTGDIVGLWSAVEVDGVAFPMTGSYGSDGSRLGFKMQIDPDLAGEFSLYTHYAYGDIGVNSEQREPLAVDDAAAPQHRITLAGVVIGLYFDGGYSEGGYAESGYADGGNAESGDADGGYAESGYDGEAHADARFERAAAARPIAAGDSVVLDCQLTGDTLDCTATGPEATPEKWRFARKTDET